MISLLLLALSALSSTAFAAEEIAAPNCVAEALFDALPLEEYYEKDAYSANAMLSKAAAGKLTEESVTRNLLEETLRRRNPQAAPAIIRAFRAGTPLEPKEVKTLTEATFQELRAANHFFMQTERMIGGTSFREAILPRMKNPVTARDKFWRELGFRPNPENDGMIWPTYGEVARNLRALQERLNVPEHLRLEMTFVHVEPYAEVYHYHALDRPLGPGSDIAVARRFLSPQEFFRALDQGLMPAEAGMHDLSHLVAWTRHPKALEAVKNLAKVHFAHPEDVPLYFRLEWSSEYLAMPHFGQGKALRDQMISRGVWKDRANLSVKSLFRKVKSSVNQASLSDLEAYARKDLIPGFRDRFENFGGGQEQFTELEGSMDPEGLLRKFYDDRTPSGAWTNQNTKKTFPYNGGDLHREQLNMMGYELQVLVERPGSLEPKLRETRIRDLIARMELVVGEGAEMDPVKLIELFGKPAAERRNSRFADLLEIARGKHSTLYRVFTE